MTQLFNDDYYAAAEENVKPEFPDIDEELEIENTWDDYDPNTDYYNEEEYEGPHCEDPNFNVLNLSLFSMTSVELQSNQYNFRWMPIMIHLKVSRKK